MKRGSLLLVFALSIFSISVFSFLPMVNGVNPDKYCGNFRYSEDCNYASIESTCVGDVLSAVQCFWYEEPFDETGPPAQYPVCKANIWPMKDCAENKNIAFDCHESGEIIVAGIPIFMFREFIGKCVTSITGDPTSSFGRCEDKIIFCAPGEVCYINENSKGICATQDAINNIQFADSGMGDLPAEETITSDEETDLASLKLSEQRQLIFKTALAVLLVALILLIVIYFKPKKKKRK